MYRPRTRVHLTHEFNYDTRAERELILEDEEHFIQADPPLAGMGFV